MNNIPEPDMSGEEMFAWFDEELDMTPEEVFDTVQRIYAFRKAMFNAKLST